MSFVVRSPFASLAPLREIQDPRRGEGTPEEGFSPRRQACFLSSIFRVVAYSSTMNPINGMSAATVMSIAVGFVRN